MRIGEDRGRLCIVLGSPLIVCFYAFFQYIYIYINDQYYYLIMLIN